MEWRDWYGDGSVRVLNLALACCTLEVEAAASVVPPVGGLIAPLRVGGSSAPLRVGGSSAPLRVGGSSAPLRVGGSSAPLRVVLVSGTVTDRLAPAVTAMIDAAAAAGPVRIVSFGACASSGGPYWDSYAVTKGVDQLVPVDVFVPGCPPPPGALHAAIDGLAGRGPA